MKKLGEVMWLEKKNGPIDYKLKASCRSSSQYQTKVYMKKLTNKKRSVKKYLPKYCDGCEVSNTEMELYKVLVYPGEPESEIELCETCREAYEDKKIQGPLVILTNTSMLARIQTILSVFRIA